MKSILKTSLVTTILITFTSLFGSSLVLAKGVDVDTAQVIKDLQSKMIKHYIYEDKAQTVNKALEKLNQKTNLPSNNVELVKLLNETVSPILNDKHFRVIVPRSRPSISEQNLLQSHLRALTQFRKGGFQEIKMLEGNVGYVKVDGFRREEKHQVDALMAYLRTADAIIFDLQENGGGGKPVNYLSSYFLPKGALIGKTYHRHKDSWKELKSEDVDGDRRLHVPLFILTSKFTFSAAEAFTYNLQAQGRATVVGEVTGGGAHPTSFFPIAEGVAVLLPNRRSHNDITQSNWEGHGVKPHHQVPKEKALTLAHSMAQAAALEFRQSSFLRLEALLEKPCCNDSIQGKINTIVGQLLYRKHVEPFMITGFATNYQRQNNTLAAKRLWLANIHHFPNIADSYYQFSLGLQREKEYEQAKTMIEQAIELAEEKDAEQVGLYRQTLKEINSVTN